MKKLYRYFILTILLFGISCDLDKDLINPNEATLDQANPDLLMNKIQLDFAAFYSLASGNDNAGVTGTNVGVNKIMRMMAMTSGSTYERALIPQNFDQIWSRAYQDVLINVETLLPLAEQKKFYVHIGTAKVMKAYVYLTLVDLFGDVPQSEALKGAEGVFNPKPDSGSDVYANAIALLDEAITDLNKDSDGGLSRDIYYDGDATKWITLANSLKLKAWLNISTDPARKAEAISKITPLLSEDLIDTDDEEFTYKYGTANIPARSRHPLYRQFYQPSHGSATGYLGNYFLKEAYDGKGIEDPRWRYYFYRQVGSIDQALSIDGESVPCLLNPRPPHFKAENPYCVFEPGFYGRDHGDASGTPPDANVMTCAGVYPAGGRIDLNNGDANYEGDTVQGDGGNGAGIEPIFMSFFTDFMKAEAVLRLGISAAGDPKELMQSGITKSVNRVKALASSLGQTLPDGLEASTTSYIIAVVNRFDAPGADQLDVVMKEYYIALFGNGIEAYNMYRRTSSPKNLQPTLSQNGGKFYRSLVYPAIFANLNGSVTQKVDGTTKVFWDKNPDDLK
jgi:hypothetical protein